MKEPADPYRNDTQPDTDRDYEVAAWIAKQRHICDAVCGIAMMVIAALTLISWYFSPDIINLSVGATFFFGVFVIFLRFHFDLLSPYRNPHKTKRMLDQITQEKATEAEKAKQRLKTLWSAVKALYEEPALRKYVRRKRHPKLQIDQPSRGTRKRRDSA